MVALELFLLHPLYLLSQFIWHLIAEFEGLLGKALVGPRKRLRGRYRWIEHIVDLLGCFHTAFTRCTALQIGLFCQFCTLLSLCAGQRLKWALLLRFELFPALLDGLAHLAIGEVRVLTLKCKAHFPSEEVDSGLWSRLRFTKDSIGWILAILSWPIIQHFEVLLWCQLIFIAQVVRSEGKFGLCTKSGLCWRFSTESIAIWSKTYGHHLVCSVLTLIIKWVGFVSCERLTLLARYCQSFLPSECVITIVRPLHRWYRH